MLRLAHKWGFDALKEMAVKEVGKGITDPITKLELGKAHDVKAWVDSAIVALAVRDAPLSPAEAASIGFDLAFQLQLCRETVYRNTDRATLLARLQTAVASTFGIDALFMEKVAEYKSLVAKVEKGIGAQTIAPFPPGSTVAIAVLCERRENPPMMILLTYSMYSSRRRRTQI